MIDNLTIRHSFDYVCGLFNLIWIGFKMIFEKCQEFTIGCHIFHIVKSSSHVSLHPAPLPIFIGINKLMNVIYLSQHRTVGFEKNGTELPGKGTKKKGAFFKGLGDDEEDNGWRGYAHEDLGKSL